MAKYYEGKKYRNSTISFRLVLVINLKETRNNLRVITLHRRRRLHVDDDEGAG